MFPLNRVEAAHPSQVNEYKKLLRLPKKKTPGHGAESRYQKSVGPADAHVQDLVRAVRHAGGNRQELVVDVEPDITAACMPGDLRLWPMVIDAAERYKKMSAAEQAKARRQ